jgi:hypothetical protein
MTFASPSALPAQSALAAQSARRDRPTVASSANQLIADLDSDRYAVRKRATRGLIAAGSKVVAPLTAAAGNGTLEVQTRVIRILQDMYVGSDNDETIDAAELALESLSKSSNRSLAARAYRVLTANHELRRQRALVQIERLGGVINYGGNLLFIPNNTNPIQKQIKYIVLGAKWKGGDDGLKFVKRLTGLQLLFLSGTAESSPISKAAQSDLQATLPNLNIRKRGPAYLGIRGDINVLDCRVDRVEPGQAAEKAGLKPRDVITSFGGKKIPDFAALLAVLKTFEPGDKVKVEVIRDGKTLTFEVVMGEWK